MEYFTARNTVILALVQEGVVTLGVLAAGATFKWYKTAGLDPPTATILFADYGWTLLALPLVWVYFAYRRLQRDDSTDAARVAAIASGVLLLLLSLILVWYAAARFFFRLAGETGGLA